METRDMRRHDERQVVDARPRGRATRSALAALSLFLASIGAAPGALAAVNPNICSITDGAESVVGDVSNVIAEPLYDQRPVMLRQQDAEDATAGATGESG